MDVTSLASSILAAQAGNTQQQVATTLLKSNLDAEKSVVQTLLGAGTPSLANVGAGYWRQPQRDGLSLAPSGKRLFTQAAAVRPFLPALFPAKIASSCR